MSTSQPVTLAEPNAKLLAEREIAPVKEIAYDSDGNRVQAWLVKPPGWRRAGSIRWWWMSRTILGGCTGSSSRCGRRSWRRAGFVVLLANPRGAPGYGEQFGHLLRTRYPGDDFDDLMRGVDAAIADGAVDAERLAVVGGVTAAWAIGHTARFRRAVARRPIVDWAVDLTKAGPMGALPWEDPDQYLKRSPLFAAQNFRTPTLILAPAGDPQAEQLYRALVARKVTVEWVVADGLRPGDKVAELEAIGGWLGQGAR